MSKILLLTLSVLIASTALAEPPKLPKLLVRCGGPFDLCGFVDRDTQAEVIGRRFERANIFSEGLAAVRIKGLWGFIDEKGEVVIQPKYDLVGDFYLGLAEALVGKKVGVIDRTGKMVVEPQFARAIPFTKDVFFVQRGEWRRTHFEGLERLDNLVSPGFMNFGDVGLFHLDKGWIAEPRYRSLLIFETVGRGLIWAAEAQGYSGKRPYGLLRADGTWQVEPQFSSASKLENGRARVEADREGKRSYSHVDENGALIEPFSFSFRSVFRREGEIALIRDGDREGFLGSEDRLLGGRLFEAAQFGPGGVLRVKEEGKWFGLDRNGTLSADPLEGQIVSSCPSGLKVKRRGEQFEIVDANDQRTTPWLSNREIQLHCDRPTAINIGEKYGYVGLDGRPITDMVFDDLTGFDDAGHSGVSVNKKYGFIDAQGKFTFQTHFDEMAPAKNGLYWAREGNRTVLVNFKGEVQPVPKPDQSVRDSYLACQDGAKLFARDGLWGIVDRNGAELVKPVHRALTCFRQGVAWAAIENLHKWCPVDPDGSVRTKPDCKTGHYPYIQTHSYPEQFSPDIYENSVLWTRAFLEFGAGLRETPPKMQSDGSGYESSTILR